MRSFSTYFSEDEAAAVVRFCGQEIRGFLNDLTNDEPSPYTANCSPEEIQRIKSESAAILQVFRDQPDLFSDDALVEKGNGSTAHQHPVRIEVRRNPGIEAVAQVAARGIPGRCRNITVKRFQQESKSIRGRIVVKKSGSQSFEFNVRGVSKALPLAFLKRHAGKALKEIEYLPGNHIDVSKTLTFVIADGDGTLYPKPQIDKLPFLEDSPAYGALIQYLSVGGVIVLVSGNSFTRVKQRLETKSIESAVKRRLIVAANGGADMAFFDKDGELRCWDHYRKKALSEATDKSSSELDFIYIGDDGDPDGNDYGVFEEAGFKRCIFVGLVDEVESVTLKAQAIGGFEEGTKKFLTIAAQAAKQQPYQPLFSDERVAGYLKILRGESI